MFNFVAFCVVLVILYHILDWFRRKGMLEGLNRRPVLITGCDSGFGRELALRLDSLGCPVFAACFTREGKESLVQQASERLTTLQLDVSCSESIQKAADFVRQHLPYGIDLWGIVNNAGEAGYGGPLEWQNREIITKVFQVNIIGVAEMCRIFLPFLKKSKGRIINVTSASAFNPIPVAMPYSCSKSAAEVLGDCLRREMMMWGVSVHLIEPGMFKTNISNPRNGKQRCEKIWKELPQDIKDEYGQDFYDKMWASMTSAIDATAKPDLTPVVDGMVHALFSVCPRKRYLIGFDSYLAMVVGCMPVCISDGIFKLLFSGNNLPKGIHKYK